MQKNILEYLEEVALNQPQKIAFYGKDEKIDYGTFLKKCRQVGSYLTKYQCHNEPIAIYLEKSIASLIAMFGIVYSGNFYVVIDEAMPAARAEKILATIKPKCIITNLELQEKLTEITHNSDVVNFVEIMNSSIDEARLQRIRTKMIDTDPVYALFTSGSTGMPKGTVLTHRNVISYTNWFVKTFKIDNQTVFGNQTPFYFSMSVSDIFSTIFTGATLCIIPKALFSFPIKLCEYLDELKINTIYWVPSALCIVANLKLFNYQKPQFLTRVLFAGEIMPMKQLNYWRQHLPNILYANLFGPTEATDICAYYQVNREFKDDESLPIGIACDNCDVFLVNEQNELAGPTEIGELYIRGSFLAQGYYDNPLKTSEVFVQNPLQNHYPEIVYRTGDLGKYNEYGELVYLSRKDFQIKHLGYRIELGEIEIAGTAHPNLKNCVAIYDSKKDNILLIYEGKLTENEVLDHFKNKLPYYMIPNKIIKVKQMAYNANGKIDRVYYKEIYLN